jgi:hypothetical protein
VEERVGRAAITTSIEWPYAHHNRSMVVVQPPQLDRGGSATPSPSLEGGHTTTFFFFFFFFQIKNKIHPLKHINKDIICWTEGIRITQIREKLLSVRRGSIIMLLNALEKEKEGRK